MRLACVVERGPNELTHVFVGQRVVEVFAVSTALHDALGAQDTQLRRECRELRLACFSELGHAALTTIELVQEAEAREIASSSEQGRGSLESDATDLDGARSWTVVMAGAALG